MIKAREDIRSIYSRAIKAVDPQIAIENCIKLINGKLILNSNGISVKEFDLKNFNKIYVVGAGKATSSMAKAVEKILGDYITKGCISVKYGYIEELSRIEIIEASHPVPDINGTIAATKIMNILHEAEDDDLVISLISGGGSALLALPPDSVSLEEKRMTTDLLLKCGAAIHEINSVRKHLSLVKGGNMAKAAYNATVINLMISDVVGDDMDVIASGPFVPDKSTFAGAFEILEKYNLVKKVPKPVLDHIKSGINGQIDENPKKDSLLFSKITNLIIASNIIALKAAQDEAERLGYNSIILSSMIEGNAKDAALWHANIAKEVLLSSNPVPKPACILSGGETTVVVKGDGLGGRNMEFVMHAALFIDGYENITIASVGTDGTDGPTDAAGALCDGLTLQRSMKNGFKINKYIDNNDSYNYFKNMGDLIITGPTNTNVMDIRIILIN